MAVSLGTTIDKFYALREQKRALEAQVGEVVKQMTATETELLRLMEKEGVVRSTGKKATASVSQTEVYTAENWDEFSKFVLKHKYLHLFERRLSVTGCRELMELKGKIPGVVPFTRKKIHLHSL